MTSPEYVLCGVERGASKLSGISPFQAGFRIRNTAMTHFSGTFHSVMSRRTTGPVFSEAWPEYACKVDGRYSDGLGLMMKTMRSLQHVPCTLPPNANAGLSYVHG